MSVVTNRASSWQVVRAGKRSTVYSYKSTARRICYLK